MILTRRFCYLVVCLFLCSSIAGAQASTSRQTWTSIDVGFGPAGATARDDLSLDLHAW
jgi:hypothetical protein